MVNQQFKKRLTIKNPGPILAPKGFPYRYYSGNWEGRWVYHPQIIKKKDKYYMFYTGKSGITFLGNIKLQLRHDIGLATSKDLKKWERYRDNPIFSPSLSKNDWDSDLVAHSYVLEKGDQYYMFYDGSPQGGWKECIGIATSKDLINWVRNDKNPVLKGGSFWWDKIHVSRCCVTWGGNGYFYMFYAGNDGICERIGVARSKDLINWDKFIKEPVVNLGTKGSWDETYVSDPKVLKVKEHYLMSYTGYKGNRGCIGLAYSQDLVKWTKFPLNPILEPGEVGSWDQDEAVRSDFVILDNQYYLFYTGKKYFFYSSGYAKVNIEKIIKIIKNHDRK